MLVLKKSVNNIKTKTKVSSIEKRSTGSTTGLALAEVLPFTKDLKMLTRSVYLDASFRKW